VHVVFSTKDRRPFLKDRTFREEAHKYLAGTALNLNCPPQKVGGVEDHVHILCRLGKQIDISKLVAELKRESSKWVKERMPNLADFYWQKGYGAFSVSPKHVDALTEYIVNQEEHHKRMSFQDEFRGICERNGVEIDERYVWE
jgi:putative transposase